MISCFSFFGIDVVLDDSVEGLIPISNLVDDYYIFNENEFNMIGQNTNKVFKVGDEIKVKLDLVNVESREITFSIVE